LVALILTKNCLNWVKLSVKGRTCCNLVTSECNSDFACCGNVVYLVRHINIPIMHFKTLTPLVHTVLNFMREVGEWIQKMFELHGHISKIIQHNLRR